MKLQCPGCGHPRELTVWSSLNASLDPEARQALLNDNINTFVCGQCRKKVFYSIELLYHDMTLGFCVQYYPPGAIDHDGFYNYFTPEGTIDLGDAAAKCPDGGGYVARPHIVFDMAELVRYVRFRERLAELKPKV
jgi:hypothetical protein